MIFNHHIAYTQQHQQQRRQQRQTNARTCRAAAWLRRTTRGE